MATIKLTWGNDQESLLVMRFSKGWTSDECLEIAKKASRLIAQKSHTVHIFVDLRGVQNYPLNITVLVIKCLKYHVPNIGLVIAISKSSFLRHLYDAVRLLFPKDMPINIVSELNEALILFEDQTRDEYNKSDLKVLV